MRTYRLDGMRPTDHEWHFGALLARAMLKTTGADTAAMQTRRDVIR